MIRYLLIFIFALAALNPCSAQKSAPAYFTIENIQSGDYNFPVLKSDQNPVAAEKINQILQLRVIGKSFKLVGKNMFNELADERGYGTTGLEYGVLINTNYVFSIEFSDQTMSAYPDYHTSYYTFNSATGNIINLEELLTKEGLKHVNQFANSYFNEQIKKDKNSIFTEDFSEEERDEQYGYIFDLTDCNANHEIDRFGITANGFMVEKDRCFPHVIQAYDIGWSCEIKVSDLYRNDLSELGDNFMRDHTPVNSKASLGYTQNAFHGKIDGKYAFAMYVRRSGDTIDGSYWYTKFGQQIELTGTIKDDREITIEEENGKFVITQADNKPVSGVWYDKNGKSHSIVFE